MNSLPEQDDIIVQTLHQNDLTPDLLNRLQPLFDAAYHNSHMHVGLLRDLEKEHEVFEMFIAYEADVPIGVVVLQDKEHEGIDYMEYPPVHIKRFTVSSEVRGKGVGKQLLDLAKKHAFSDLGLSVIYGESNEASGLSFYVKQGALFDLSGIRSYNERMTPQQNIAFFHKVITDPWFRNVEYRFPTGNGIVFAFCKEGIQDTFESRGYMDRENLDLMLDDNERGSSHLEQWGTK